MTIAENVKQILAELPEGVKLVAAAKTRTPQQILEAVEAGVSIIGENYVQEAESAYQAIGKRAEWHFIGHLQKNKVKRAIELFEWYGPRGVSARDVVHAAVMLNNGLTHILSTDEHFDVIEGITRVTIGTLEETRSMLRRLAR